MTTSSIQPSTVSAVLQFVEERDWDGFHSPENLAKSICIEAAELLEFYHWIPEAPPLDDNHVRDELADVLTYCIILADKLDLDMNQIILDKLAKTRNKYPAATVREDPDAAERLHWAARNDRVSE